MNPLVSRLLPTATNMIRLDHTHVMSTFHQYKASASPRVRKGLASTICTALEVHAALEEEIFYPALREATEDELVRESMAEHQEMKRLIGLLRRMEPEAIDYDETVTASASWARA
jgi:hemerythrin superfamily protein